jgi:hypothetical protein
MCIAIDNTTAPIPSLHLVVRQDGMTALIRASRNGHEAVCALLLDKGADMEAEDVSGERNLHECVRAYVFV